MRIRNLQIIFLLLISANTFSQSNYYFNKTRGVSVETDEGELRFEVLTEKKNTKISLNLLYYWYNKGNLYITQGAHTGYLLHGEYFHFEKDSKNLIEKGSLKDGLKTGTWMVWTENGLLFKIENWKKGLKNGVAITYNSKQQVTLKSNYKKDMLHGWQYQYENGELVKKNKYKKNKLDEGGFLGIKKIKLFARETKGLLRNKSGNSGAIFCAQARQKTQS